MSTEFLDVSNYEMNLIIPFLFITQKTHTYTTHECATRYTLNRCNKNLFISFFLRMKAKNVTEEALENIENQLRTLNPGISPAGFQKPWVGCSFTTVVVSAFLAQLTQALTSDFFERKQ